MDFATIRDMTRANALTHPVDRVMIDHVVEQIKGEVTWLHQQVWRVTAEECQRDLSLLSLPFFNEENTYATEVKDLIALLWMAVEQSKANVEWCQSLFQPSPVRTLPLELLSHIFAIAGGGDSYDVVKPRRHGCLPAGHSIIHVCKYWRDVALQTKELWTHPIIVNHHGTGKEALLLSGNKAERSIHRLAGVIALYGNNLTHVILHCRNFPYSMRRLFDIIVAYRHQLVSLDIVGPSKPVYSPPFNFDMPLLKRLSVPIPSKLSTGIAFATPTLKKVFLCIDPDSTSDVEGLQLPWRQITELSIGLPYNHTTVTESLDSRPPVPTLLHVLPEARNLVYLHLTCLVPGEFLEVRVTLPRLKTFEIHDKGLEALISARGDPFQEAIHLPFTISAPALEQFDLIFSVKPTRRTAHGDLMFIGQLYCEVMHRVAALLQRSRRLFQVRIMLCSPVEFLGRSLNEPTGDPSGRVTTGKTYRITGDSAVFTRLNGACRIWEGTDAVFNISSPHVGEVCFKETLAGELWMDGFIDRFTEECPSPHIKFTRSYTQVEYMVINAMLNLLGESGGLPNCGKQLYLAP